MSTTTLSTPLTRRQLLTGAAQAAAVTAGVAGLALGIRSQRCADATLLGRRMAQEMKRKLSIDARTDLNHRADLFCEATVNEVVWEDRPDGRTAFAQHLDGRRIVFVPTCGDSEERDRTFIYFASASLYVLEPGEMMTESQPCARLEALWRERHAFARSFSREFFA